MGRNHSHHQNDHDAKNVVSQSGRRTEQSPRDIVQKKRQDWSVNTTEPEDNRGIAGRKDSYTLKFSKSAHDKEKLTLLTRWPQQKYNQKSDPIAKIDQQDEETAVKMITFCKAVPGISKHESWSCEAKHLLAARESTAMKVKEWKSPVRYSNFALDKKNTRWRCCARAHGDKGHEDSKRSAVRDRKDQDRMTHSL
eukprot:767400-Hanusia_phi.AAC.2